MKSLAQYVRWLTLALCTVATLALNHQRVATWRVTVPAGKGHGTTVVASQVLVLKERVELPTLQSETPTLAGPVLAMLPALPADPLGAWLAAWTKVVLKAAGPASARLAGYVPAGTAFARLLGSALAPQAP